MKSYEDTVKRKDVILREKYETGRLSADEFLQKLFSSREGDRKRQNLVKKKEKVLQRA